MESADEMLWQIEQTTCKPHLSEFLDWYECLLGADKVDFDLLDMQMIEYAVKAKVDEFNARVLH